MRINQNKLIKNLLFTVVFIFAVIFALMFVFDWAFALDEPPMDDKKDWEISASWMYVVYDDKDIHETGAGVKAEARWKYVYLWGSWEQPEFRLTGQRAGMIDLFGVGAGGKVRIWKPLSVFVEIGYYIPKSDLQNNPGKYSEGISYKWHETLSGIGRADLGKTFTDYRYELKSGLGGSLGMELKQEIYRGLHVSLSGAYRFLKLKEDWDAYNPNYKACPSQGEYIQTKEKRSFNGGIFNVGVKYEF